MQKWEYFVAPLLPHNPGEILNSFGDDGWELVNVVMQQTPAGGVSIVAYLFLNKYVKDANARTVFWVPKSEVRRADVHRVQGLFAKKGLTP